MKCCLMQKLLCMLCRTEPEYLGPRTRLCRAGLSERRLRQMEPEARVAALEEASLDPYDYIFLAC